MTPGAWYFGESIGEAQGAKRAAEQQYLNLALANRNFDQEQQARIDRQAAAQHEAERQNYLTGLAQAQQRRANALQAARIRASEVQARARLRSDFFQEQQRRREAAADDLAIQSRFDVGQTNQNNRAVAAAKAAEAVRQQAKAARDEQAFFNNLNRDPNILNRDDLKAATAGLPVGPERMDMATRALAGRQRRALGLRESAEATAKQWNDLNDREKAKGRAFSEVVIALKNNAQDSYLVEPDFTIEKFVPRKGVAHKFGTDALDYFNSQGTNAAPPRFSFPPADEPPVADPDDPVGLFP